MGQVVKFIVGSHAFFSKIEGFTSKDIDYVMMMDKTPRGKKYEHVMVENRDYFIYRTMTKMELIDHFIHVGSAKRASIFLIPEVIKYFGVTMTDLDMLQNVFYHIDDKHMYLKMIYDYYRQNNGFFLTSIQFKNVYDDYKKKRIKPENTDGKNHQ